MTPTEWEITTLGLLEKLKGHFFYDEDMAKEVKEFVRLTKKIWKEEENAKV